MIGKFKFIIFLGATLLLSFCMIFSNEEDILKKLSPDLITFFSGDQTYLNLDSTLSGNGYQYSCTLEDYLSIKDKTSIDGICFETNLSIKEILSRTNAKILEKQNIENSQIYYCYIENNNDFIVINNHKVNMQVAMSNGNTIVGFPIILGSY